MVKKFIFNDVAMLRYILTLTSFVLIGCQKKVQTNEVYIDHQPAMTCEENPLFCDDFDDEALPEYGEETDTGE